MQTLGHEITKDTYLNTEFNRFLLALEVMPFKLSQFSDLKVSHPSLWL
jgi:hypothetical protein